MSKIWKIRFKTTWGGTRHIFIYDETKLLKAIRKYKKLEGTIEEYEVTSSITIENYINSLTREIQLDSILTVTDDKSILFSEFFELLNNSPIFGEYDYEIESNKLIKNKVIDDWNFLTKSNEIETKIFFKKYRTFLLNYSHDTVEWYTKLLSIAKYSKITPHRGNKYSNITHRASLKTIKEVTDKQRDNFTLAKENLKIKKKLK